MTKRSITRPLAAGLTALVALSSLALAGTAGPAGAADPAKPSVLVVEATADAVYRADVQAKLIGTGAFDSVELFDAEAGTPTAAALAAHDAVLTFSDAKFADAQLLGNRLANYVDGGGHVVVATFANVCSGDNVPGGRFEAEGYSPLGCGDQFQPGGLTLVPVAAAHPMLEGVGSFHGGDSSYHADGALAAGATLVAEWSNGVPLVAVQDAPGTSGSTVVALNFYPPSSDARDDFWDASTDGARLMANALAPPAPPPPPPPPPPAGVACGEAPPSGFVDVPRNVYYTHSVDWAKATGVTTGVGGSNRFEPLREATRAETLTMVWRAEGSPQVSTPHGFIDVVPNSFYEPAVRWAKATGVTTGVGGSNRFEPDALADRAQQITFLWRIVGSPVVGSPHGFIDVPPDTYFTPAVRWAKATGVTTGIGGGNTFEPFTTVDRAQQVTFLCRQYG